MQIVAYSHRTRNNVNGFRRNSCKLVLTITRTLIDIATRTRVCVNAVSPPRRGQLRSPTSPSLRVRRVRDRVPGGGGAVAGRWSGPGRVAAMAGDDRASDPLRLPCSARSRRLG